MHPIRILCMAACLMLAGCYNPGTEAVFYIEDVSVEQEFIDSTSSGMNGRNNYNVLRYSVEGELDSAATLTIYSYPSRAYVGTVELGYSQPSSLKKYGKLSLKNFIMDYYEGDTLLVKFTPKGCKKGHLTITTDIHF